MITKFSALSKVLLGLSTFAIAASGNAMSLSSLLHLHPQMKSSEARAHLTLTNTNTFFRDVRVGAHVYTIQPHQVVSISAPVGTPVYAANKLYRYHTTGSLLTEVQTGDHTLALD